MVVLKMLGMKMVNIISDSRLRSLLPPELKSPRHCGDSGGGQLPPSTVSPVQPAGSQEGAQWAPSGDRAV